MSRYIVRRLLIALPVLIGITFLAFVALSLAPGDPLLARVDPNILAQQSPEWIVQQRHALGLDRPVPIRYLTWLGGVLRGDLGFSIVTHRAIASELMQRVPATLQLMAASLIIGIGIGLPFGVLSAIRPYSTLDYVLTFFTMIMISVPTFFMGLLVIYLFGVNLRLLPTSGMTTLGAASSPTDRLRHLILPAGILGLRYAALLLRYTRSSMLDVLGKEYLTTARAKGLRNRTVLSRHALRNALIPIITVVGLLLPELVGGAVITEQIFAWPGMGFMAVRAAADRDPSMLMGVVLVVGTGVLLTNLLVDLAYGIADPRIRFDGRGAG